MSEPHRHRVLALFLGTIVGSALAGVGWSLWNAHRDRAVGEIEVVGNKADIDALLAEHAREPRSAPSAIGAEPIAEGNGSLPMLVREPIPEAVAERLFPQLTLSKKGVVYDPHTYYRFRGNMQRKIPFAERPEGEWLFRTNSDGLREDAELASTKPDLRVIVAGDSHTEGYCNNSESYPNLVETALRARHPNGTVEVVNTGKSGYSFYNYLGVLEKYLEHRPDVFVMGVYGGNDFIECTTLHHYFQHTPRPVCEACSYDQMLQRYPVVTPNIFQQAFMQLVYFRHHPEERAVALEAATQVTAEAQRICRDHGVRFIVAYLPPMVDVQKSYLGSVLTEAIDLFKMSPDDLEITNRLADDYMADARARGIECVDMRDPIKAAPRQLYWDRDHHLNLAGNRVVAVALIPEVERVWH